jgi:hypothetical protein
MNLTSIVLFAVAGVLFLLYLNRRRNRLNAEE